MERYHEHDREPAETTAGPSETAAEDASAGLQPSAPMDAAGTLPDTGDDLDLTADAEPEEDAAAGEIEAAVSDALDDDLTDMDFGLSSEDLALSSDADSADEGEATMIARLDDDAELGFDDEPDMTETVIANLDDDLDLELPTTDGDEDGTATVIANLDDDLDLDGDFSLEPETDEAPSPSADGGLTDSLDDIDDLDLSLDVDLTDAGDQDAEPPVEDLEASLEDLSLDFDMAADGGDDTKGDTKAHDEDELTLALDTDPDEQATAGYRVYRRFDDQQDWTLITDTLVPVSDDGTHSVIDSVPAYTSTGNWTEKSNPALLS